MGTVVNALANASYNGQQCARSLSPKQSDELPVGSLTCRRRDFLGGAMVTEVETVLGRWNDDILWPSQAGALTSFPLSNRPWLTTFDRPRSVVAGAEVYGPSTNMPGANGPWMTAATKTFDQAYQQWDNKCSGGIYWVRLSLSPARKSKPH